MAHPLAGTPLLALLKEASAMAERNFNPREILIATILAEDAKGAKSLFVCPMGSAQEEIFFREMIPAKLFYEQTHERYVFFSEAWRAIAEEGDPIQPSQHPNRLEIVSFTAAERSTGYTVRGHRQINRLPWATHLGTLVVGENTRYWNQARVQPTQRARA